jgi:hypothetical protein
MTSRRTKKPIGELAEAVLAQVDQEQLAKTAALSHTSPVSVKTVLGQLMVKTAAAVRQEAESNEISYDDLAAFRKNYVV